MGTQDIQAYTGHKPLGRGLYLAATMPLLAAIYAGMLALRFAGLWDLGERTGLDIGMIYLAAGTFFLLASIAIGWLGIRRARTVGAREDAVLPTLIPWLQLVAIPWLAFKTSSEKAPADFPVVKGVLAGLVLAVGAEILTSAVTHEFGFGLFVASPFLVGLSASYFAVRAEDPAPIKAGQIALLVASLVMFGFAYEGLFCLVIIYPIVMLAALAGSGFGVLLGRRRDKGRATVLSSVAMLPLLLVAETSQPPLATFGDVASVEVEAPPAAVWDAIVHMGTIAQPPAAPFGWGLAYPVAGHIDGEGVGAVRRGVFSTGVAYERVTRWDKDRALWFDVLSDPPMMRETNPFGPVRSAHLDGYFQTGTARFAIAPLPGGRARLTLATTHVLKVGPTPYFLPIARWAVDANKTRVLAHFVARAEAAARGTALP